MPNGRNPGFHDVLSVLPDPLRRWRIRFTSTGDVRTLGLNRARQ
jgi:hypothetical protein